jgi:hypothetical protein
MIGAAVVEVRYNSTMEDIHRDIETYWRELFANQIEECLYSAIPDDIPESRWFDEGMRHALMLLRHMRTDEFDPS